MRHIKILLFSVEVRSSIPELNYLFEAIVKDEGITMPHLCIYMALFQCWNKNGFSNPVLIQRREVMRLAKIHSKTTYHKCIKALATAGYICYAPSFQPRGSLVYMLIK